MSTLVETIQKPLTENEQQIRYQGKYNEAETMNQQALAGYERALGPEHPDMSTGMDNHSRVFETMSRRIRRRWTLAGYETVLERGYPDTPTSVSNLAGGLQAEGQYNEAELMNQQAPAEYERALGSESPDTPMGMDNLSGVLQDQSMSYEGRSLFDELKRPRVTADGSRLCEGCDLPLHPEAADLPPSSLWPPGMLRFQPLLLRVSAERGCKVCAFIQKELVQRVAGFSFNDPEWDYSKRGGFVSAQNFQGMIDGKLSSATFEIFADVSSSNACGIWKAGFPSGDTSSASCLAKIKHWLDECTQNHQRCMPEMDTPLPTRLIHIINDETCTHPTLRLVTTNCQQGQYLTLSHCWGSLRPGCITTCDSIQRNLTEIPWDSLPLTFQEAAIFTARLGFRFLWIDSMCIIQDDIDDWRRESANMADIYSNSLLTIAATHGLDGSKGLFSKIAPEFEAVSIPRTGLKSEVYFRQNLDHFEVIDERITIGKRTFADIFPLMFRAWTFQELQLSRRTVHFLRSEVQWECLEAKRCECHPETQPTTKTLLTYEARNIDLRKAPWMLNVVKFYATGALSFSRDKLPALAGLARKFERINSELGRYCAGLWEKTLKTDICWHAIRGMNSIFKKRPTPWRAPTWSWASIDEAIEKPLLIARSGPRCLCSAAQPTMAKAKLTDVWKAVVVLAGPDRFGEISFAYLIISADVFPAILTYQTLHYENGNVRIEPALFIEGQLFVGMVPDYLLCEPGEHFIHPESDVFLMYCGEDRFGCVVTVILTCVDPKFNVFKRIGSWTSMSCRQAGWIDLLDWRRIVFKWV